MKVTLYQLAHSPYCIPVSRILEAYGVPFEVENVSAWDRRVLIELTAGAYYQVPVLVHGEAVVHETGDDPLAVPRYLDAQWCGGRLFPTECAGLQELVVQHVENVLEGIGFRLSDPHVVDLEEDLGARVMSIRHKERRFGAGCVEVWRKEAPSLAQQLEKELEPYELRLAHSPFLLGEQPVYADYALYGVLGNFQYGGHHRLAESQCHLRRWEAAMKEYRQPEV